MADGTATVDRQGGAPRRGKGFPFSPREGGAERALAALSTWSVQEALTPRSYSEPRDLLQGGSSATGPFSRERLPWLVTAAQPRKDYVFFHRLHLGSIDLRLASARIVQAYGREEAAPFARGGNALLGMALADRFGMPVAKSLSVSSFGWALPLVLGRDLAGMGEWEQVEQEVMEQVNARMCRAGDDGKSLPLAWDDVMAAHEYLVTKFAIPRELVRPPAFSIRIEHHVRARSEPSPFILNSFYLRDIGQARALVSKGEAPQALRAYMGVDGPARPVDLLTHPGALRHALSPTVTSHARWPSPGGHPLVTLQQAAANAALAGLGAGDGLLSANGPPGTGKTTLLREIVAGCVLRRAAAMAAFENPSDAFRRHEAKPEDAERGRARRPLYLIDESLTGHEILVASSNNKAVENISRELPLARALGRDMGYFRTLSDALAGMGAGPEDERPEEAAGTDDRTWGLSAAVLGNAENRNGFVTTFWRDEDHGLRTWLRLARGDRVTVAVKDDKGKQVGIREPHLLRRESPPRSPAEAMRRWQAARARFLAVAGDVADGFGSLAGYERALAAIPGLREALASAGPAGAVAERAARAAAELDDARAALGDILAREPAAGAGESGWTLWDVDREEAAARVENLENTVQRLSRFAPSETPAVTEARTALAAAEATVAARAADGALAVDDAFFASGHEAWNLASPWVPAALQSRREDLFEAAIALHEAFAGAAAEQLLANLAIFAECNGPSGVPSDMVPHLGQIWSSLFLVVPVVSTTFASVGRMLPGMAPASLGWLVVDEAGQAVPQAAVGAVLRCRRALVVGDPLQIEPVVTLPRKVTDRICAHYGVDPRAWCGPEASVQTLADAASPIQGTFHGEAGPRRVGMPLLVHRRCQEPMFGISNRVAYGGQMVFASGPAGDGPVGAALGPSSWIDVTGMHSGKWCYEHGEAVVGMLRRLADEGVTSPDIFLITPFRDVAAALHQRLRRESSLIAALGEDAAAWTQARVGTIHTFQGREAEAVVLVLGADGEDHGGARAWVGATPNIVNVAASRARRSLYVVGSHAAWEAAGVVGEVARALPTRAPEPGPAAAGPAPGREPDDLDELDALPPPPPRRLAAPGRLGGLRQVAADM